MRRHLTSVGLLIAAPLALAVPLLLTSCGDDTQATPIGGGGAGGGAGAGGLAMSGGSAGTAGTAGPGGGASGSATGGVAGSGGAAGGTGGAGGAGGAGGKAGAGGGGNGGTGGNPVVRVFTIEGCDIDVGAGGAGGADGSGGATDAGGAMGDGGAGGPGPLPNLFASFTVYNFETDQPVQTCVDKVADFSITITGDAPITVLANIAPGVSPASVIWIYDNVPQGAHNIFPYSLGPDENGNYQEPTPPLAPGEHELTITAYDQIDGLGNVLGTVTITFTVIVGA